MGVKQWSLTLRKEHGLRVFENRVLRRIFGPNRDEVTEDCRNLYNEELHNFHYSPSIIKMMKSRSKRFCRACSMNGAKRNSNKILEGNKRGKRPLGRPSHRWVGSVKTDLGQDGVLWAGLMWLRIGTSEGLL
jgi:hypothetical protein